MDQYIEDNITHGMIMMYSAPIITQIKLVLEQIKLWVFLNALYLSYQKVLLHVVDKIMRNFVVNQKWGQKEIAG
jgi:hypothetical protein